MAKVEPTRVEVVRSGGFAGLVTKADVRLEQLEPAARAELDAVLTHLGLLDGPTPVVADRRSPRRGAARDALPGMGVDRFEYEVSLFRGRQSQRVTVSEVGLDEKVRTVLEELLRSGSAGQ